jgi:TonB family protein
LQFAVNKAFINIKRGRWIAPYQFVKSYPSYFWPWSKKNRILCWRAGALFLAVIFTVSSAAVTSASVAGSERTAAPMARQLWRAPVRDSRLGELAQRATRSACALTQPPEALATPDPLMDGEQEGSKITVSFIIGTDGTVRSPLILEGAGGGEDWNVLEAVRSWRYRPALCNGVPMEAEAKIEFSNR